MCFRRRFLNLALLLFLLQASSFALAAHFGVGPMMVELNAANKTGLVKVNNVDNKPLQLQVRLFSWSQNSLAESVYEESDDLIFFPRLLEVKPGEERLIRIGVKSPPSEQEKSYVLFIEEMPAFQDNEVNTNKPKQTQIAVTGRFGVLVFVSPLLPKANAEIAKLELNQGRVSLTVNNPGNVHLTIPQIKFDQPGKFSKTIVGGTLLSGAARSYYVDIPADTCTALDELSVTLKTQFEKIAPVNSLRIDQAACH